MLPPPFGLYVKQHSLTYNTTLLFKAREFFTRSQSFLRETSINSESGADLPFVHFALYGLLDRLFLGFRDNRQIRFRENAASGKKQQQQQRAKGRFRSLVWRNRVALVWELFIQLQNNTQKIQFQRASQSISEDRVLLYSPFKNSTLGRVAHSRRT